MKVLTNKNLPEYQLYNEIAQLCLNAFNDTWEAKNKVDFIEKWGLLKEKYLSIIKSAFPEILFNRKRDLNGRTVSIHEFEDYKIENVIFESLQGWEVNGSLYIPKGKGPYPGVICPTGHSSKIGRSYQIPAQTFARNGYIAISFDPPGCAGEIKHMNDHFTNGVVGYLTGFWSQTHFIADALSAIDYLETRQDIDKNPGFAMTGVSGGGITTIFSSLLDNRIKFCAPVCCLSSHKDIHLRDLYTSCPEQFGYGYIAAGIDYVDYISLVSPKPCLLIAGKLDEVFGYESTTEIYKEAKKIYNLMNAKDSLGLFVDENAGHEYNVKMAGAVVNWMNKIIKNTEVPALMLEDKDVESVSPDLLKCYPSNKVNMFTINRDEAEKLDRERVFPENFNEKYHYIKDRSCEILGIKDSDTIPSVAIEEEPDLRWVHYLQKIDIKLSDKINIPGLLLRRANSTAKRPALLFIDEKGKWEGFKQQGFLTRTARFLEREGIEKEPTILSVDVSGIGELSPQPASYDLAGWNDIERILTYLSISLGKPIMGFMVRDALAALNYLENRPDVDKSQIIVGGRGIGAIAALYTALISQKCVKVICMDMLSHYGSITEVFPFAWKQTVIIPNILKYYDLPDIADVLSKNSTNCKVTILNPKDAQKNNISEKLVHDIYKKALEKGAIAHGDLSIGEEENLFIKSVYDY